MTVRRELFAGVMSGTSLDAVDAVLADFAPGAAPCRPLAATHIDFPTELRDELWRCKARARRDRACGTSRNKVSHLYVYALRSVCYAAESSRTT
jgi:anhydro-N-acetylmuramic acid kinase